MDNATSFLTKLAEDKGLQATLMAAVQTAVTKEEKVAATTKVANEAGFAVSADELQKMVESIQTSSAKLSDNDLENVAGGKGGGSGSGNVILDDLNVVAGGVTTAANTVAGGVETGANTVADGVSTAASAVASVFSGW